MVQQDELKKAVTENNLKEDGTDALQSHQLALTFLSDAKKMYDDAAVKQEKVKETEDKSLPRGKRSLRNLNEAISRRGDGMRIEEKYGSGTYVDVRTGNQLPALEAHVLARTS